MAFRALSPMANRAREDQQDDNYRKGIMDRDGLLQALEAGEFDGISHDYQPYDGHQKGTTHQVSMSVSGGTVEVTKITRRKFFDGKETTCFEESGRPTR
jgi:hypothetical protein